MDKRVQRLISAGVVVRDGKIQLKDQAIAEEILQGPDAFGISMEVIEEALKEVQSTPTEKVEIDTAYKWAARSIACFLLSRETKEVNWFIRAEDYRHEAIEHASLAHDGGQTVQFIESEIDQHRFDAKDLMTTPVLDIVPLEGEGDEEEEQQAESATENEHEFRKLKTLIEKDKTYRVDSPNGAYFIQIQEIEGDNISYLLLNNNKRHTIQKPKFQSGLDNGKISVLG